MVVTAMAKADAAEHLFLPLTSLLHPNGRCPPGSKFPDGHLCVYSTCTNHETNG